MTYNIAAWAHSADKNHNTMSWGTLTVDKTITDTNGVTFYTYEVPFYVWWTFDKEFHKWLHSAEHLVAYKKDTGSVRDSLEQVTNNRLDWKVILDISPYRTSKNSFWFRITSMVPLEIEEVQEVTKISVRKAKEFLEEWKIEHPDDYQWIPFARSISCWQYDFHNKQRAIADLKAVDLENLNIVWKETNTQHKTAYVCDLRFLKPKLDSKHDMVMFSPDFSYKISELIEKHLPEKLNGSIALVGTFGCMTGMYICISSEIWDESDIAHIHASIIKILKEKIDINSLLEEEKSQLETLLKNYRNYWKRW